jgi:hypothetical protein
MKRILFDSYDFVLQERKNKSKFCSSEAVDTASNYDSIKTYSEINKNPADSSKSTKVNQASSLTTKLSGSNNIVENSLFTQQLFDKSSLQENITDTTIKQGSVAIKNKKFNE